MDFELDLSFQTLTDNMAASKAPTTTNVSSSTSTTTTSSSLATTTAPHICHNFQELCRSCGKINTELYDLFQTTNSPFNTSSATCYTHFRNSISCTSTTTTTANKPSANTAVGCAKYSTDDLTFDSVAATAKATAKGQSNMDNILQEMQIWQLKIKCNDGLPQRICAKCTAQFYMIHKFRRKCLKVQTQLRALNEEQKFYERQQEKENPTTAKDIIPSATSKAEVATETAPLVEANDLVNDNCGEQQAAVDNTKSAVSFVTNTGNTNTECIAVSTRATTLLDNIETMPQKTEANEPTTPTSSAAPVFSNKKIEAQEHCTITRRPKDEKKPLLKAAVLNFIKTSPPPLTLQPSSEQICDNDATDHTNPSKKLCLAQESMLDRHIIFKTSARPNKSKQQGGDLKPCQHKDEKMLDEDAEDKDNTSSCLPAASGKSEVNGTFNLSINPQPPLASKSNPESLFITKAALKAYTASSSELNTKADQHVTPAIEAKNSNDTNNNAHSSNLSSDHCDRLSQDNHCESTDNTCSSTSSSTQSPCCSSKSSSISSKSHRTRVLRHKAVKYATHNKKSGHCYKSSAMTSTKKMTKMTLKKKQRSWQNKHKSKRLADIRTCLSTSALRKYRQPKQHKMYNGKKHRPQQSELQMEDETSSNISATSSSSSAYTSYAYSSATTPAVTDLVENQTLYCKNANENLHKTGSLSTGQGISSNKSCIMWKTKAAMKANANDVPVAVFVDNKAEPTSYIPAISSFTYTEAATATGSASALLSLSLATENSDNSSKTLDENQSISSSTNINHNNNNILMEEQHYCSTNTVLSSPDNQVKDTEDESEQNLNHNLWPEEADQKQINAKNNQANEDEKKEDEQNTIVETKLEIKEFNATIAIKEQEKLEEVDEEADKQHKPTVLTPKTGGMKLIIQRKRGARFKCRRKTDDDPSDNHDNHEATTPKRRKRSSHNTNLQSKLRTESLFLVDLNGDYFKQDEELTQTNKQKSRFFDDSTWDSDIEENVNNNNANRKSKVPEFNSEEDENKENPIALQPEFESDSNNSVYRDPLLIRNDMLEDDTQLTDFPKPKLSLQTECSKEMYKLYKEKINLESPKKLIVRVPLTSLTQDFKRLHLTMDKKKQESELQNETTEEELQLSIETNEQKTHNETLEIQTVTQQEETVEETNICSQANTSSSQSDLLGFSQNSETSSSTVDSSQPSIDMVRSIQPPLCSASSKINDFINDFQNNCIDSSEIEETCDIVPQLGPRITQELSDEIRDVEDTLNGILSEMHDKDMYNPRSAETDEFFPNSVYSPLTDSPTTPAHSFYAESPCTINSNPMSVSPFIHHNMDYNAMTPQSNHSSMGHGSHIGSGGSTGPLAEVFSEHFPNYTECFEESTQSELIGFQNDIPCFENIEIINPDTATDILTTQGEFNEEEEIAKVADTNSNAENIVTENVEVKAPTEIVDYIDLSDYKEDSDQFVDTPTTQVQVKVAPELTVSNTDILPNQMPYNPANYQQLNNTPTIQIQNSANRIISTNTNTQPHYIVTNTNQGPIIIANPQLNHTTKQMDGTFKPHSNNLQFVTLGQAMETNQAATNRLIHNHATEINWPNAVNASASNYNQQPVVSAANGTTTYFINANGELYQASIPNSSLNTIIVPNNTAQATFNKSNMDNSENFMQTLHQQRQQQNNTGQSSQYIMLVNNLGGTPQYYATTHTNLNQTVQPQQPAVLFQRAPQTQNIHNDSDFITNSPQQSNTNSITKPNPPAHTTKSTHVPITPALEEVKDLKSGQTMHQRVNQQLQKQIKQRQLQLLQPRSPNVTQKITLVCRFCHKRPKFTNNVDYSNHIINTHPAEMPYNCPHCPMHFARRFERQQHVAQVHGSRYQCAQCGLSFCAQRTLDFHLQKYHANLGRSQPHLQQQQQQQQNSTSTSTPATYQLLQHDKRQRLVRVEDVHVQVTGENKNKRSIDLALDGSADIQTSQQLQQQPRKLCSPDCNNDNDDCCGSNKNYDQHNNNNTQAEESEQQQYAGSESVNNNQHNRQHHQQHQYQHVTIPPSPEQTEPDSTTTLRHFRKRQLSDITPHFATSPTSSSFSNNNASNDNLNHNSPENALAGDGGSGAGAGEQIVVERSLRGSHNCLLCEESFTNEIALRKHHHLAHGATQTQTTNTAATLTGLVCTICKRGFRMRNALQRHMETHDAEGRPYECNICQVRFPRPSQLTLHKLTVHKFEKPISCEECGKQFGTESAMKAHAEEHHPYGEEAGSATTASSSLSALSSSTTPPQLSSRIYLDTITTSNKTATISTSGEDETTASTNTSNNNNAALENTIVSGFAT